MITSELFVIGGVSVSPAEVIKRFRMNMLIHSYLYYWLDDPIWSDDKWQQVADDLTELQFRYPDPIGFYDKEFEGWNGSTGMHLPKDNFVITQVSKLHRNSYVTEYLNKGTTSVEGVSYEEIPCPSCKHNSLVYDPVEDFHVCWSCFKRHKDIPKTKANLDLKRSYGK